jgi:ankyrin repeat protein
VETIELVFSHGASLAAVSAQGRSAFLYAAEAGNLPVAEFLLRQPIGFSVHDQDFRGNTALHLAAERNRVSMIRWLVGLGAHVNTVNNDDNTPLCLACAKGKLDAAVVLIELGADVDHPGKLGKTPLMCAVVSKKVELAHELITTFSAQLEVASVTGRIAT